MFTFAYFYPRNDVMFVQPVNIQASASRGPGSEAARPPHHEMTTWNCPLLSLTLSSLMPRYNKPLAGTTIEV